MCTPGMFIPYFGLSLSPLVRCKVEMLRRGGPADRRAPPSSIHRSPILSQIGLFRRKQQARHCGVCSPGAGRDTTMGLIGGGWADGETTGKPQARELLLMMRPITTSPSSCRPCQDCPVRSDRDISQQGGVRRLRQHGDSYHHHLTLTLAAENT